MTQLIKLKIGESEILIEPDIDKFSEKKVQLTGGLSEFCSEVSINTLMKAVSSICSSVANEMNSMNVNKPTRFSAGFGFRINGEGNFYIIKAGSEASIQITAEWENK